MKRLLSYIITSLLLIQGICNAQNWIDVGPQLKYNFQNFYSLSNISDSLLIGLGDFILINENDTANGMIYYKDNVWYSWPILGVNYGPGSTILSNPIAAISYNDSLVFSSTDYVKDTIGIDPPWGPFYQIRLWKNDVFDTIGSTNNKFNYLKVLLNDIYLFGWFSSIDGNPCRGLAKYNGLTWECLDPPFGYGGPQINDIFLFDNKLWVGVNPEYPLNKDQLGRVLTAMQTQIKQLEFFTILKEDEEATKAEDYLSGLRAEYAVHEPTIQLYKGDNAFDMLKKRVELTENSFLVLQQGSRSLSEKLFRKFMINELIYSAKTPLIVLSS